MRTYFFLLSFFMMFVVLSCKKQKDDEELSTNRPEAPEAVSYDLNNDSVMDISVEYRSFTWDGFNASGFGISGIIMTFNNNEILVDQGGYTLFSQLKDTIRINAVDPYKWGAYERPEVAMISSVNSTQWPKNWKILSSRAPQNSYYAGVKIQKDNIQFIGWLKLKIDQASGSVQITDKQFTQENFIVIDR